MWDPAQYLKYADERARPFGELLARVQASEPRRVVDLGCGLGNLTATLASRWPTATIEGVDSSSEMIEQARSSVGEATDSAPRLSFRLGRIQEWSPGEPVDVLVSNAALQWVPDHLARLAALVSHVAHDGWFAFQVPGNFREPGHVILRDLAADPRWGVAGRVAFPSAHEPMDYVDALARTGCTVDAWETTYLHVLGGPDPVFEWISGAGARSVLSALDGGRRAEFAAILRERLRAAYPRRPYGTVLAFRRIFIVARAPGKS